MNPIDFQHSSHAGAYHMSWQSSTDNHVPSHFNRGTSFPAYNEFYQAEALDIPGTGNDCGLITVYQPPHQDWCTQEACNMPTHRFHSAPQIPPTSDFNRGATTRDIMPYSDYSGLPAVPNHLWGESLYPSVQSLGSCDSLMGEFTVTGRISCDIFDLFEPDFYGQSAPPNPHENPSNDSVHRCEWSVDGSPCNTYYPAGDNLKHNVSRHLSGFHNLSWSGGKSTQICHWLGCAKQLKSESIVRHILTVHLHVTTACKGCGTSFARQDSLQRHMRNSCGAKEEQ